MIPGSCSKLDHDVYVAVAKKSLGRRTDPRPTAHLLSPQPPVHTELAKGVPGLAFETWDPPSKGQSSPPKITKDPPRDMREP
jgi:hypothetical protein